MGIEVIPFDRRHWDDVRRIYDEGIATGHATFATESPSWEEFDAGRLPAHRLLAVDDGVALGWIAVTATSSRPVYRGVVEHSLYVAAQARGRGVGRSLLEALIDDTERAEIWTIESGIFPENVASLRLHHALGFRIVGTRERLGLMTHGPLADTWRDVILVERRTPTR